MATLQEQIQWETECAKRGAENYYATQDRLREGGRTEQSDAMQYIMRTRMRAIGDAITEDIYSGKAGIQSKYIGIIRWVLEQGVTSYELAFIGLQVVIKALSEGKRRNNHKVTKMCVTIGEHIETEMRCRRFEANNPAYFDLSMKSLDEDGVKSYAHRKKSIMKRFRGGKDDFTWSTPVKAGIGAKVLQFVEHVLHDVFYFSTIYEGGKTHTVLATRSSFDEWCAEFEKEKGLMEPAMLPLKIQPMDWDEDHYGGYYTPRMQFKFPFIKAKGKDHREFIKKFKCAQHVQAVNKLQATAWKINTDVLEVLDYVFKHGLGVGIPSAQPLAIPEIPEDLRIVSKDQYDDAQWEEFRYWKAVAKQGYREEARRKGQVIQFLQTIQLARELADWEEFYFAYSCDFRGRIYCATTCLSPQSNGVARALLKFKKAERLGESGVIWLALHGANQYGIKGTYEERLEWVRVNAALVQHIVQDPISALEYWAKADEPYKFLAWCFEWHKVGYGTDVHAESDLVVGIDGSCNGLQHFSAILRDPIGARATNLSRCPEPQDIYGEVAKVVVVHLENRGDGLADLILEVGVDRSTTKKQCMTLPYGATKQSCREYTYEWVNEHWESFDLPKHMRWKVAAYLSIIVWDAIGETVVAARVAMEWLQKNVSGRFVKWVSPVDFPVYQFYKKVKADRVDTRLAGKTKLTVNDLDRSGEPNNYKQRLGIVPNFIHSVDASHLVMTTNESELPAYSMIHDEFGTHAGHVQHLYDVTRWTFWKLHHYWNPLEMWAIHQGIPLEFVPQRGTFDIAEVLESKYIFG